MRKFIATLLFLGFAVLATAQTHNVTGLVLDENGQPLPGVAVYRLGTTDGTLTAADGTYSIKAAAKDILVYSFLGYNDIQETVEKRKKIDVVMKPSVSQLSDAVVIAYGTQAKSDLTGSVGVVNMDELEKLSITSIDQALQGRVAGVEVTTASGEPGSDSAIRIRGTRSINASNDPLIVVDGIVDAVESFSDIDPSDVKSISILKDASSTALYGARGSNGVIMVTTRTGGKDEKVKITFKGDVGVGTLLRTLDVMDGPAYAAYRNDVKYMRRYQTGELTDTDPMAEGNYYYADPSSVQGVTDWQRVLTQPAVKQNYVLSVSSGGKKASSYASAAYTDQQGTIIGTGMKRLVARLNLSRNLFKWLEVGASTNYTRLTKNTNKVTMNGYDNKAAACLSPLLSIEDTWNRYGDDGTSGGVVFNNPYLQATKITNQTTKDYLLIAPYAEFKILKSLKLKSTLSYTLTSTHGFYYSPSDMPFAASRHTGGTASRSDTQKTNLLSETVLTWKKTLGKSHKLEMMGGFTAQNTAINYNYIKGTGYLDDGVGANNIGSLLDSRTLTPDSYYKGISRMSWIARANYNYAGRYYLTLTGRADGSSMFAEGHKWAMFPAAALKWNLSKEPWMKDARHWLSDLSIRLSAGRSGNDGVSSYVSQATLSNTQNGWIFGDNQEVAFYPTRLDNDSLTWEKTDSYNVGLDVNLLKNRIVITADAYMSFTSDLLLSVQNAAQSGYTSRMANVGSTRNTGMEFSIESRNISKRNFLWSTNFSIAHNTQVVTSTGAGNEYIATYSINSQMMYGYVEGYPVGSLWGYQYAGVWHNDDERAMNKITKAYASYKDINGYAKYVDANHDGVLDQYDRTYLGCTDPIIEGGLQNTFTFWNNLSLGVYFTYSLGAKMYNLTEFYLASGAVSSNQYSYMKDRFHPVNNPKGDLPAAYSQDRYPNSRYVHDASFLRLKNINISYKLDLSHKIKWMRDITLALDADNLLLWTPYNGYDPDVASTSVRKLDNAAYPYPRTVTFSIKLRY